MSLKTNPLEYRSWRSMHSRCKDKSNPWYGARGISVCKRWSRFDLFLKDMGLRPSLLYSLERKNNKRGYSPNNCFWGTDKQQARNRRTNLIVTYEGREMSLAEACEITGFNYDAAKYRVYAGKPFNQVRNCNASDFGK